ncbi:hypothetical protein BD779DRAFT_1472014 [Infundibulicybe gibba]|nr:hypothetical protein BD779DRAFT_1472014 [Infundibulicybe gibba]
MFRGGAPERLCSWSRAIYDGSRAIVVMNNPRRCDYTRLPEISSEERDRVKNATTIIAEFLISTGPKRELHQGRGGIEHGAFGFAWTRSVSTGSTLRRGIPHETRDDSGPTVTRNNRPACSSQQKVQRRPAAGLQSERLGLLRESGIWERISSCACGSAEHALQLRGSGRTANMPQWPCRPPQESLPNPIFSIPNPNELNFTWTTTTLSPSPCAALVLGGVLIA